MLVADWYGFRWEIWDEILTVACRNVVLGSIVNCVAENPLTFGTGGWRRLRDRRLQFTSELVPVGAPKVDVRSLGANGVELLLVVRIVEG